MRISKFIILLNFLFSMTMILGQGYTYSYNDPCTGIEKQIQVPSNGIAVTYYGELNTFTPEQFQDGTFDAWAASVYSQYGNNNPCGSTIGVSSSISVAQYTSLNSLNILNSLSFVSDMSSSGVSDITGGIKSVGSATTSKENKSDKRDNKNKNKETGSGNTSETTQPNSKSSETTQSGSGTSSETTQSGSGESGSSSSESGGSGSGGSGSGGSGSGNGGSGRSGEKTEEIKTEEPKAEEGGGKSNTLGGSVSSTQKSSDKSTTSALKPTIVVSSDFAGFNFKNNDVTYGAKGTGGYTAVRWDGLRTHGITFDYNTSMKGPNITGFYAFLKPTRTDLFSATLSFGFTGNRSIYGTIAAGQMWSFKKPKRLKYLYMVTFSYGELYKQKFLGTAFITGAMYDFKITKRFDVKLTNLFIYAPLVRYYNDIVLKSPYVIMPLIGTNINLTKKFKFNINMGGTYAIKQDVMNFTIMFGTRFAL